MSENHKTPARCQPPPPQPVAAANTPCLTPWKCPPPALAQIVREPTPQSKTAQPRPKRIVARRPARSGPVLTHSPAGLGPPRPLAQQPRGMYQNGHTPSRPHPPATTLHPTSPPIPITNKQSRRPASTTPLPWAKLGPKTIPGQFIRILRCVTLRRRLTRTKLLMSFRYLREFIPHTKNVA